MQINFTAAERAALKQAMASRPPDTLSGLIRAYGDPRPKGGPTLYGADRNWVQQNLVAVSLPVGLPGMRVGPQGRNVADVHRVIVQPLTIALRHIVQLGLVGGLRRWDGCWSFRYIAGSDSLSTHAFAIGFDINGATNKQGTAGDLDRRIAEVFEQCGWIWGGRWSPARRDSMHFQWTLPEPHTTVPAHQDAAIKPSVGTPLLSTPAPTLTALDAAGARLFVDGQELGIIDAATLGGGKLQVRRRS